MEENNVGSLTNRDLKLKGDVDPILCCDQTIGDDDESNIVDRSGTTKDSLLAELLTRPSGIDELNVHDCNLPRKDLSPIHLELNGGVDDLLRSSVSHSNSKRKKSRDYEARSLANFEDTSLEERPVKRKESNTHRMELSTNGRNVRLISSSRSLSTSLQNGTTGVTNPRARVNPRKAPYKGAHLVTLPFNARRHTKRPPI
ncbi:hypothetical protein PMAYCL1PPCAC_32156 [Pristionchus mayeri]|uniref:Uncharacterized protein n=1 Tax=Pristionchus mayeri TaxID=1317129 RepID=A0AAN5DFB7_9BILA|nr:hypothetical protein PMAYCL1PPCAC_32156 [Pristionchus mayeri]